MIAGVCSGLAEYFAIDTAIMRIGALVALLLTGGVAFVAYLVAMIIVPEKPASTSALGKE